MSKQVKVKSATEGLSKRDQNLFNQMVVSHSHPDTFFKNFYDQKQYKQALRNGEQIMENNKDHAGKPF
jgi:hypothetical protein